MTLSNPVPHRLDAQLKVHKVTKPQLSAYLGRSVSTTSAWLRGLAPMPLEVQGRLETLLHELEQAHPPLPIPAVKSEVVPHVC
jgi:hypothetical protein